MRSSSEGRDQTVEMATRLDGDAVARILNDLDKADLGDPRRTARAKAISERLAAMPNESLPTAMGTDAELEGAYRFFSNEQVSFEDLFEPHAMSAAKRAAGAGVVLAVHDTTQCQFAHADAEEVGYLNTGQPGFLLHMSLLLDTRDWRRPLGLVHAETLTRKKPSRGRSRHASGNTTAKWKDKEFGRWMRGIQSAEQRVAGAASIIHLADREADSYELIAAMAEVGQRFIIRGRHNRVVFDGAERVHLRDLVDRADVVLEREVPLSRRLAKTSPRAKAAHPPREGRTATLHFATTTAELRRPRNRTGADTLTINIVHVFEPNPPNGQEPVEWLLLTTEPIDSVGQLELIVDYYRCRWTIEELNKALKTGCVVQARQLESREAILNMLALSLPIAVELLALRSLARAHPSRPASELFSPSELAALRHLSHRPLPSKPTVQDALWCVAGVGGHIKNNGPAGWQVLQRGMQKFVVFAAGWRAATEREL
jgi:hypothetical protein